MIDRLKEIESLSLQLEPSIEQRQEWVEAVNAYSFQFMDDMDSIKAYRAIPEEFAADHKFDIPNHGHDIHKTIEVIEKEIDHYGLNPASGGHLGYIPGGGVFPTALGDYLAAVFNRYAGLYYAGPGAVKLENFLIRWMCDIMGYPKTALGNLTSGGSIANLIAITTARDSKGITSKKIEQSVIYLTVQAHYSIKKAIRIVGLGDAQMRYLKLDDESKMDTHALATQIEKDKNDGFQPFLVVGSAGTTDVGAIDQLDELANICEKHNLWFHIDGAYGGFFILIDELKHKFKGIERADSITVDPHKGLFLSYGSGAVLIKDVQALNKTHQYQANYFQDAVQPKDQPSPAELSPELTKHFRGLRMWLPLKLIGLDSFKACVEEKWLLALYMHKEVQKLGFEVGPEPQLSVCIYRYLPEGKDANEFNLKIIEYVRNDGTVFISSTSLDGVVWLRLAALAFRTHKHTIDQLLKVLSDAVAHLSGQLNRD